jgi:hypothetical protein
LKAAAIFEVPMSRVQAERLAAAIRAAKPRRPAGVIDVRLYLEDGVGRLVSLWESRERLESYLAEADVPRGTELMLSVGLEPVSVRVADVLTAD